ncbi:MAG: TolC family protein [Candidatus Omnitrophica bacterium]|nr:TolC family protein [Candidatus Omnitrophota bacterium]
MKTRLLLVCASFLLVISGCAGPATKVEKTERAKIARAEQNYRPKEARPQLPVLTADSELKDFVKYAVLNSPRVEEAFYQWKSTVEAINASKYPANPQLSLLDFDSVIDSLMPGVMFMVPAPGKLSLSGEAAALEAGKTGHIFEGEVLKTAFRVKELSYQSWVLKEKIKLTEEILQILRMQENVSLARVKTNEASLLDPITIQIEKEKLANMLADFKDSEKVLTAQFGAALGILQSDRIPKPMAALPFTESGFSEKEIWESVQAKNPRLALLRSTIEQSEVYVKLAYKEQWPDFNIGLMQGLFSGMALTRPLLSISIPWPGKSASQVAASKSAVKMTEAAFSAEELDLAAGLADGLFRWRQADREVKLYRENLLPKSRAATQIAQSGYRTGKTGLADFLNAERTFLDFSVNYLSAQGLREITLNEISLSIAGVSPEKEDLFR